MIFKVSSKITCLIFDFDGLLVDTESPAYEAWQTIYSDHDVALDLADWVHCVGSSYARFDPVAHLAALTGLKNLDGPGLIARKNDLKAARCQNQPLQPGAQELIDQARKAGMFCVVASSSHHSWVDAHLERTGLITQIAAVICGDDVAAVKPAPDLFLKAAAAVDQAPEHCLVLEDSPNGILAAQAAGCDAVAVPNGITAMANFPEGTVKLESLSQVELPL